MTAEQQKEVVNFALGLAKMAESVKRNTGVSLTAEENKAVVNMVRVLSRPRSEDESN
jgi:hypothetical protein